MEDYKKAQDLRKNQTVTRHTKWDKPAHIFPMTGILYCGYCGSPMRGVSNQDRLYYRDGSSIEHMKDCPRHTVRAEALEGQVVDLLKGVFDQWEKQNSKVDIQEAQRDVEERFERARELYLAGDLSRDLFQTEKERYEKAKNSLRLEDANVIMTLVETMRPGLNNWDSTLPKDRKKLLRTAIRAAFVRGDTFVALQPTEVFWPLTEPIRCQSEEGGTFVCEQTNPA